MIDRYERIRKALEMGPTLGEWYWSDVYPTQDGRKTWSLLGDGGFGILSCDGEENSPQNVNAAAAELIAACDPDTIRELLDERDQLAADLEATREDAERWRALREMDGGEIYALLGDCDGIHPEQADAAIDRACGKESRMEEREQRDEALLRQAREALSRAHQTAMEQTLKARIPECGEFAGIAQDLDFVVAALRERLGDEKG